MAVENVPPREAKSVHKQLAELYDKRSAIDQLIRCLEGYAAVCQTKGARRERLKNA
jgi:hypothetical protein